MSRVWQLLVRADGDTAAARREMKSLQRDTRKFGRSMMSMGQTLTAGITAPIIALGAVGVKELMETRSVTKKTEEVFKSMGDSVKVTRGQFDQMVDRLSEYSAIEGDIVQANANVALSFKALAGNPQLFEDTMKSAVDMSAALGTNTQSSVLALGKAMQDPAKGALALSRNGTLAKTDIAALQKMAKDGVPVWKQQQYILKRVNEQYAGQGKNVDPIKAITLAVKDTAEVMAEMLLPTILGVSMKMQDLAKWVKGLSDGKRRLLGIVLLVAAALGPLLMIVGQLALAWAALIPVVTSIAVAFGTSVAVVLGVAAAIGVLVAALIYAYVKSEKFRDIVNGVFRSVADGVMAFVTEVQATITVWADWLVSFWTAHGETITAVAKRVWEGVRGIIGGALNAVRLIFTSMLRLLRGDWRGALEALRDAALSIWGGILSGLKLAWDGIRIAGKAAGTALVNAIKGAVDDVVGKLKAIWSQVASGLSTAWDSIKDTAVSKAASLVSAIVGIVDGLPNKLAGVGRDAGRALADALKAAVNAVLDRVRSISLPSVEIAGKKIGGGKPFGGIPRLARGGITEGLSFAGEDGPEAVIPMGRSARNRADRNRVMREAGLAGAGGNVTLNVYTQSSDTEAIVRRVMFELSNNRVRLGGAL